MRKYLKHGILAASILAAASLGDLIDINDRIYYPLRYHNTPIREGTYEYPFSIGKRYLVREGLLEVQIGNQDSNEYYTVTNELRVNERKVTGQLMDTADEIINSLSRRANRMVDKIKGIYDGLRRR